MDKNDIIAWLYIYIYIYIYMYIYMYVWYCCHVVVFVGTHPLYKAFALAITGPRGFTACLICFLMLWDPSVDGIWKHGSIMFFFENFEFLFYFKLVFLYY
jgi:hypothetical protein